MNWIENVSKDHANRGIHYDTGGRGVLISIIDPCSREVTPAHGFQAIHRFEFLDTEDPEDEFGITDKQAEEIAKILRESFENSMNVVVNCHAGLCRSGAVAECGIMIGFQDTEKNRIPNILVKTKIMKALGLDYSSAVDEARRQEITSQSEWD